jgi:NAD(P)-dependent dehydrogenase (short-subunit alcohol dehydrogenase family)
VIPDRQLKARVTGAAREGGIGQAIVARLQADRMKVVTLDVEPGCTFQVDVVRDELPPLDDIDVLVCNAALTTMFGAAHSIRIERWQRDLDVNLTGTFRVVQACLRGMREREFGRIVVISSTAASNGMPAQIGYSTSKAGLLGMTRTIAAENVAMGITANAVLPGMTASSGILGMPQEIVDAWVQSVPMGELVRTEDIAEAVAFFASPATARITGQTLTVDGGDGLETRSVTSSMARPAQPARPQS